MVPDDEVDDDAEEGSKRDDQIQAAPVHTDRGL